MKLIPVKTPIGEVHVNPDAVVTVRPRISTDDPKVKSVVVVLTGSVSVTEEQGVVVERLQE